MGLLDFLTGCRTPASPTSQTGPTALLTPHWPQGAVAQLVGANLISPLLHPAFQLDAYLPRLLALGPEDEPPKTFTSITSPNSSRLNFDKYLISELCDSFSFLVSHYGKTTYEGFNLFMWKDVRMKGLPVVTGFIPERTEEEIQKIWDFSYLSFGNVSKPALTIASGNAGWTTLDTALQTIATPASKVIWLATVDAPGWPTYKLPNEAAVLLMIGHPAYDTGRTPLAYFTAPAVVPVKDVPRVDGERTRVTALRLSVEQACAAAGIAPTAIGTVVRDCGRRSPAAATRLAEVAQALHALRPDYEIDQHNIDMPAVLGELGANTVNYSLLMAAYAAHMRNHPVLYLSNRDPEAAHAMLILPPRDHTPPDPHRTFTEHAYRSQGYAPWWGQRLDGKLDY